MADRRGSVPGPAPRGHAPRAGSLRARPASPGAAWSSEGELVLRRRHRVVTRVGEDQCLVHAGRDGPEVEVLLQRAARIEQSALFLDALSQRSPAIIELDPEIRAVGALPR